MANKKHTRSSKRPLVIALLVVMLMMTIVFAFVGCNTRNKAEEPDNEQTDEIPEEEDPPLDEEEKEDEAEDDEKEKKTEEVEKTVTPPVATKPYIPAVKPTTPPATSKPVTPPASTNKYGSITIKKDGRYSETKTYDDVTIKADRVKLLNKTIKGDLIIDKSVDDDALITLDNVEVMGEIIINGGYDFRLYDVEADMLKVKKKNGKVRLSAFDKTEIKDIETYRSIYLKEDDLSKGYDGFVNLTTKESNNIYIEVESFNCDLEGLYCNDITKVKGLDDSIYIDTVIAYDRIDLGSRVRVKTFTAYESDCTYVIEPNKIYTKSGADEPERYKSKDKKRSSSSSGKNKTPSVAKPDVSLVYYGNTISASWPDVTNAVKYKVSYSIDSGSSWYAYAETTATNHNISGITDKNSFRIKVLAVNSSGKESSAGGTSSAISEKLATPANVKVEFSGGKPTISWDGVSGTSNYYVTYTINGSQSSASVSNGTSYALPAVSASTTVKAQVKAIGNGSNYLDSDISSTAEASWTPTKPKLDTPSAPIVTITDSKVKFDWQTEPNIGKYVLEYKIGTAGAVTAYPTSNTYTITETVPNGTKVISKVKYVGNGTTYLDSKFSPDGEATSNVITTKQLASPTDLVVNFNNSQNKFTANWTTVPNASGYSIKYTIGSGDEQTITSKTNSCEIPEVINTDNTKITVSVMAVGNVTNYTNSPYCSPVDKTSTLEKLATPSNFSLDASTNTLSWNKIDGATSYDVTIGSETSTKTVTTNSIDLTSYVGQQINSIDVIAKAVGKLDSDKGTLTHTQTELKTPTISTASYETTNNTLTLTFASGILSDNANYDVKVKDSEASPVTVSGDTITATVTTDGTTPLIDGTYTVTVTATANNISVYTSNGSKTITGTYDLNVPTTS